LVQVLVNVVIIYSDWDAFTFLVFILLSGLAFVGMRFVVEGRGRLMGKGLANEKISK